MPGQRSTPELVLYYHPHSFYSQKVVMTLYEKKIPFHGRYVNILNGKQFTDDFLALNPRGEVPVLVDDNIRHIPDSAHIIDYLEDNFSNGSPRLRPEEPDLRNRCDTLNSMLSDLKIECLSFGSAVHTVKDLGINPKPPYCHESERAKIREVVDHRKRILRTEAKKFPKYADALNGKLKDVEKDLPSILNREMYENLILQFEKVLDECEAELASHKDPDHWLITDHITTADVSLSIILYRLWLLGFEKRMWERNRPSVERYFNRMKKVDSFRRAISMTDGMSQFLEYLTNPITLGVLGTAAVLGGGYLLWSKGVFAGFFGGDEVCECAKGYVPAGQAPQSPALQAKLMGVVAAAPPPAPGGKCKGL